MWFVDVPWRFPDWFTKGDAVHQQWQHLMLQSKHGFKRNSPSSYKNVCSFNNGSSSSSFSELGAATHGLLVCPKWASFQDTSLNNGETQTARDFIDAWSTAERDINDIWNSKCPVSSRGKLPLSSLTLSMCGADGSNEESRNLHELTESERENGGCFKSQPLSWMNPVPWMASPPGGPLAEALCLGMASTVKPPSNAAASVHGGSSSTTPPSSSSSSRSSCGDGNQGLPLIHWGSEGWPALPQQATILGTLSLFGSVALFLVLKETFLLLLFSPFLTFLFLFVHQPLKQMFSRKKEKEFCKLLFSIAFLLYSYLVQSYTPVSMF